MAEVAGRAALRHGHVATWEGPLELIRLRRPVQLGRVPPGPSQLHVDDPAGVSTSHAGWTESARARGYSGRLAVEYFDLRAGLDDRRSAGGRTISPQHSGVDRARAVGLRCGHERRPGTRAGRSSVGAGPEGPRPEGQRAEMAMSDANGLAPAMGWDESDQSTARNPSSSIR